jgi:response regulator of citrate/malate metabolism
MPNEGLAGVRASLHAALEQTNRRASELESELAHVLAEARNLRRALEALDAAIDPKAARAKAAKSKPKSSNSGPSPETLKRVLAVVHSRAQVTAPQAAELAGISKHTARRALVALRDRELVRVAGRSRGGGDVYAPMPNGNRPVAA